MDRWVMSKILLLIEFWSDDRDWLNKEMDDDQVMKQCLPLVLFKLLGKFCNNVIKVLVFKMDTLQPKCDLQLGNSNDATPTTGWWSSSWGVCTAESPWKTSKGVAL